MIPRPAVVLLVLALFSHAPLVPAGEPEPATDPLPAGAVARLGSLRFRQPFPFSGAAWSPDGKVIYTSGQGLQVWDARTGQLVKRLGWRIEPGFVLALAPDGKRLATAHPGQDVQVWDLAAGRELRRWPFTSTDVAALAFSPDGKTLVGACADGAVRVWEADSGKEVGRLAKHPGVRGLRVSADGRSLILSTLGIPDAVVKTLDVGTGREIRRFVVKGGQGGTVLWSSPDGKFFAGTTGDRVVRLWDAEGKELQQCQGQLPNFPAHVAFSPDNKLLATANTNEHLIRIWDPATGGLLRQLKRSNEGWPIALAFLADGHTLLVVHNDGALLTWDAGTGKELGPPPGYLQEVSSLALAADGRTLALGCRDGTVRLWDTTRERELQRLVGHTGAVTGVAMSASGKMVASVAADRFLRLWDTASGTEQKTIPIAKGTWWTVAFSPDGAFVVLDGPTPRLWQVNTGRERVRLARESGAQALALSADGKSLITRGTGLSVWSTDSGKELRSLPGMPPGPALALSPDGKLLAVGILNDVVLLDFATLKEVRRWRAASVQVARLAFTRDGGRLLSVSACCLRVWDPATGREVVPLPGHHDGILKMAIRDRGRGLATVGMDRTLRHWDLATGRQRSVIDPLPGGPEGLAAADFSANGALLAVHGSQPQTVFLLNGTSGKAVHPPISLPGYPLQMVLSPEGKRLAVATFVPGGQLFWDLQKDKEPPLRVKDAGPLVAFIPGTSTVLSNQSTTADLLLWDLAAGKETGDQEPHRARLLHKALLGSRLRWAAVAPSGATLAVGGLDPEIRLLERATGRLRLRLVPGRFGVEVAAFSPDGRLLASGDSTGAVDCWDAVTGRLLKRFTGHTHAIRALAFTPAGDRLLSGSLDSTVLVWDLKDVPPPPIRLTKGEASRLWDTLADDDAEAAYQAVYTLAAVPDVSLPVLEQGLRRSEVGTARQLRLLRVVEVLEQVGTAGAGKLLKGLTGDDDTRVIEAARAALARLAAQPKPAP